jgi:hypothetical protein
LYDTSGDLAQSTSDHPITRLLGNGSDESVSGSLQLFNPSSTTYVKHFICDVDSYNRANYAQRFLVAGYGNTTSAVNAVRFQMSSGNFDGTIYLYAIDNS